MDIKNLKGNRFKFLIIALAAGILLIMISGNSPKKENKKEKQPVRESATEQNTEKRLEKIIEKVSGVSDVSVFLSYENKGVKRLAYATEENNSSEDKRKSTQRKYQPVPVKEGSAEAPFVGEEVLPRIRGVIICAKGLDDEITRLNVAEAVSAALDVPVHRVKVLPGD